MDDTGEALGRLIFEVLRTGAALDQAGAALVAPLGLTPARWQVLATLVHLGAPETVAGLARRLGQARQSVQRVADDLVTAGLAETLDNPADRRARLLALTADGRVLAARAEALRRPWTAALADGFGAADIAAAAALLQRLRERLQAAAAPPPTGAAAAGSRA